MSLCLLTTAFQAFAKIAARPNIAYGANPGARVSHLLLTSFDAVRLTDILKPLIMCVHDAYPVEDAS